MKKSTPLLTLAVLFLFSCKDKDDDAKLNAVTATDYFPLTVGSYWVYQWYNIDNLGNETIRSTKDSVFVSADTIINGLTYAILQGTEFGNEIKRFYRDSSGFLVDEKGEIPLFTIHEEPALLGIDTFYASNAPWFWREYKMAADANITVSAGTFENCLTAETYLNPIEPNAENGIRIYPFNYAEGIGLVRHRTSFYYEPLYLESRLISYHIEPAP